MGFPARGRVGTVQGATLGGQIMKQNGFSHLELTPPSLSSQFAWDLIPDTTPLAVLLAALPSDSRLRQIEGGWSPCAGKKTLQCLGNPALPQNFDF